MMGGLPRKIFERFFVAIFALSCLSLMSCAQSEDGLEVAAVEAVRDSDAGNVIESDIVIESDKVIESDVVIESAWVRLLPPTVKSTALYFTITNQSKQAIKLDRITLDWANRVEFHETLESGGMMQMVPLSDTHLAPGKTMIFQPGGKHVMVMGLHTPLEDGVQMSALLHYSIATDADESQVASVSFDALVKQGQ